MDDVVPVRAGHREHVRGGADHPPTEGATVLGVGPEEVPEPVGRQEPFEVDVGARGWDVYRDCDWQCPRDGGVRERGGARLRVDLGGRGDAGVVGGTGPAGRD